jgi:hypothetical protein
MTVAVDNRPHFHHRTAVLPAGRGIIKLLFRTRARRFAGRCARHKRYNPAIDGRGGIKGGCLRCQLLAEIYETSLKLNRLIRQFEPRHDDSQPMPGPPAPDPRQMTFLDLDPPEPDR